MDIIDCINEKRSVRSYTNEILSDDVIKELLVFGTKSSTGSGMEPWGFVVIKDKEEIDSLSTAIKKHCLENMDDLLYLKQYEESLKNSKFHVFNNTNNLLIIYGDTNSHWYLYDCSLVAGNIMLAAHSMGIGTCWIGFAEYMLNTNEFKEKHGVPLNFELVSPLSIGYIKNKQKPPTRKEPIIFN